MRVPGVCPLRPGPLPALLHPAHSLIVMGCGDLSPEAGANFGRRDQPWAAVHVHVEHQVAEGGTQGSKGSISSAMHRKMRSTPSCWEISPMPGTRRSRHMRAKSFSWYLQGKEDGEDGKWALKGF